jgi:hypothetical protein
MMFSKAAPALGCTQLVLLASLKHHDIRLDTACRLVVVQRTGESFRDLSALAECFGACQVALKGVERKHYRLLLDVRLGPAHSGEQFERAFAEQRGKLIDGFERVAALVSTAVGRLQVQRHAKEDGRELFVSSDQSAVFNYLQIEAHPLG